MCLQAPVVAAGSKAILLAPVTSLWQTREERVGLLRPLGLGQVRSPGAGLSPPVAVTGDRARKGLSGLWSIHDLFK